MNNSEILEIILSNLKTLDKYIMIRDKNMNIIFPKDYDSIRNIERLAESIKNGKEFKDKKTGNNYIIRSTVFYHNGDEYLFDIIENNNKLKKIEEKAKYDSTTKLLNKDAIYIEIENHLLNKDNDLKSLAVVVCDIDNFKRINDTYGHPAGDKALEAVAKMFDDCASKYENLKVGRFGGDEFVFVYKNMNSKDLNNCINKLKNKIQEQIVEYEKKEIKFTMSFGIYAIDGIDTFEFSSLTEIMSKRDEFFSNADKALYESKQKGKNQITLIVDKEKKFRVI